MVCRYLYSSVIDDHNHEGKLGSPGTDNNVGRHQSAPSGARCCERLGGKTASEGHGAINDKR